MPIPDPRMVTRFWTWFKKNQAALLAASDPDGGLLDEMFQHLSRIQDGLMWEISGVGVEPRELIFSADGVWEFADAVEAICDSAPVLPSWRFIRFRPRMPQDFLSGTRVDMSGLSLYPRSIEVALDSAANGKICIDAFIQGCPQVNDPQVKSAFYILLDAAIGEFDVMSKVGPITIHPFETDRVDFQRSIPFLDLRDAFDSMFERMHPG